VHRAALDWQLRPQRRQRRLQARRAIDDGKLWRAQAPGGERVQEGASGGHAEGDQHRQPGCALVEANPHHRASG